MNNSLPFRFLINFPFLRTSYKSVFLLSSEYQVNPSLLIKSNPLFTYFRKETLSFYFCNHRSRNIKGSYLPINVINFMKTADVVNFNSHRINQLIS